MKTVMTLEAAVAMIPDGATLMIGGFFGVGSPLRLIQGLVAAGRKGLTIITNDTGVPRDRGRQADRGAAGRRLVASHIGANPETQRQMIAGELEVELVPQGTLAERIRAGGFGLGGVLTRTGLGTLVEQGKRTVEIDGETWLLETPLRADFALVLARQADYVRQPDLRADGAELQPGHGHGGATRSSPRPTRSSPWGRSRPMRSGPRACWWITSWSAQS